MKTIFTLDVLLVWVFIALIVISRVFLAYAKMYNRKLVIWAYTIWYVLLVCRLVIRFDESAIWWTMLVLSSCVYCISIWIELRPTKARELVDDVLGQDSFIMKRVRLTQFKAECLGYVDFRAAEIKPYWLNYIQRWFSIEQIMIFYLAFTFAVDLFFPGYEGFFLITLMLLVVVGWVNAMYISEYFKANEEAITIEIKEMAIQHFKASHQVQGGGDFPLDKFPNTVREIDHTATAGVQHLRRFGTRYAVGAGAIILGGIGLYGHRIYSITQIALNESAADIEIKKMHADADIELKKTDSLGKLQIRQAKAAAIERESLARVAVIEKGPVDKSDLTQANSQMAKPTNTQGWSSWNPWKR